MKKIFSLFCAMALVLSVSAAPVAPAAIAPAKKIQRMNVETMALAKNVAKENITLDASVKHNMAKHFNAAPAAVKAPALMAADYVITGASVADVTYWGGLFGDDALYSINIYNPDKTVGFLPDLYIDFEGKDGLHLAGSYPIAVSADTYFKTATGDSLDIVSGNIELAYVSFDEDTYYFTYHVTLAMLASDGNNYSFDSDIEIWGTDMEYLIMYFYQQTGDFQTAYYYAQMYAQNYGWGYIEFEDTEIVPTGDVLPLEAKAADYEFSEEGEYLMLYVEAQDSLVMQVVLDAQSLASGVYNITSNSQYLSSCWIGDLETQEYVDKLRQGSATITVVNDSTLSISAQFLGLSGDAYSLTNVTFELYVPNMFPYEPKEPTQFTISADAANVDDLTEKYGIVDFAFGSELDETFVEMFFLSNTFAIPAGTYPLVDTAHLALNTFVASIGYDYDYDMPNPSYAEVPADEEGYVYLYYFESGNITIAYSADEATMYVTGTVTTHNGSVITLDGEFENPFQAQGVKSAKAAGKAVKTIQNGQLVIERNGVHYNAAGAMLK